MPRKDVLHQGQAGFSRPEFITSGALWVDHIPWQKHIGFQNYCLPQASLSNKQVDLCKQQELQ